MSLGTELLDEISQNGVAVASVDPSTEEHIVINDNRFISVPNSLKRIAVQFDHDIETVTFDCPRYWDDNDMSKMAVYINYMRPDGFTGAYIAKNVIPSHLENSYFFLAFIKTMHNALVAKNTKASITKESISK